MKVALVRGPSLNPWEIQVYEMLKDKVQFVSVSSNKNLYETKNIKFSNVELLCLGQYFSYIPKGISFLYHMLGDPQYLLGLEKVINGFDIVHAVEITSAYSLQAIRAKRKGLVKAVTLVVWENIPFNFPHIKARDNLKKEVIQFTDHFFVFTKSSQIALLAEGVPENKISNVGATVNTRHFTPRQPNDNKAINLRKKISIGSDEFVILSVGRMVWEKGWYDLIRAAHWLQLKQSKIKLQKKVRFLFVGTGHEEKQLRKMVINLNLEDTIIFYGPESFENMPQLFQLADLFILPSIPIRSWNDQYGTVSVQAMASQLPIIATQNEAIIEVIAKGGLYVIPQNFSQLANAIVRLVKDPSLCSKLGHYNRSRAVNNFDVSVVGNKIYQNWIRILKKKQ